MLLVYIILNSFGVGVKLHTTSMEAHYGDAYPYILNCKILTVGTVDIIFTKEYRKYTLPTFHKSTNELNEFNTILDKIGGVKYSDSQNDPDKVKQYGGNCQALSLLLDYNCKKYGITSKLEYNTNHMWNSVQLDQKWYKVDLTKNEMKLLEE